MLHVATRTILAKAIRNGEVMEGEPNQPPKGPILIELRI